VNKASSLNKPIPGKGFGPDFRDGLEPKTTGPSEEPLGLGRGGFEPPTSAV
jgi:hypothetical protein